MAAFTAACCRINHKDGMIKMKNIGTQAIGSVNSSAETTVTGYGFLVDGLLISFIVTTLLFLGYAAYTFAIDRERGITRHGVVMSISRSELILAKYISLCLLALFSIIITLSGTWLAANLLWDLGPLIEDGYQIIGVGEINAEIILGFKTGPFTITRHSGLWPALFRVFKIGNAGSKPCHRGRAAPGYFQIRPGGFSIFYIQQFSALADRPLIP